MKNIVMVSLFILIITCAMPYPAVARTDVIQGYGRQTENQGNDEASSMNTTGAVSDTKKADSKARVDRVPYSKNIIGGEVDDSQRTDLWKYKPMPVTTEFEAQFDRNNNGMLEPEEAREMLRKKISDMETRTMKAVEGARAQSNIEATYDLNKDGYIGPNELEQMKKDLQ